MEVAEQRFEVEQRNDQGGGILGLAGRNIRKKKKGENFLTETLGGFRYDEL